MSSRIGEDRKFRRSVNKTGSIVTEQPEEFKAERLKMMEKG